MGGRITGWVRARLNSLVLEALPIGVTVGENITDRKVKLADEQNLDFLLQTDKN